MSSEKCRLFFGMAFLINHKGRRFFNMKNTIKVLGIIAIIAVIGFSMAACDNGGDGGNGNSTPAPTVTSIAVTTQPTKTVYDIDEALDTSGMVVTATYSDGSESAITGYTTSGFNSATAGKKTVIVTYSGKTTTFNVDVPLVYQSFYVAGGWIFTLVITLNGSTVAAGDSYALTVESDYASVQGYIKNGTIASIDTDGTLTLQPNDSSDEMIITIKDELMTSIDGQVVNQGFMFTETADAITITKFHDKMSGRVIIPAVFNGKPVTVIGGFYSNKTITSVTIPDSVITIEAMTFSGCTSLTSVTIPDSVTSIGNYAFYGTSLTSVTLPTNSDFNSIGERAFMGCTSLTSITIPSSVTSIGDYVLIDCPNLTSVTIEGTITYFGQYGGGNAFYMSDSQRGDLKEKYLAGGPGTYTREANGATWTKTE
jgi:hypothetical protein